MDLTPLRIQMRNLLYRTADVVRGVGSWIYTSDHESRVRLWVSVRGDETHRVEYDLTRDSVVCDIGGFRGDWASEISARYGCKIHVFEPVPQFAHNIAARFSKNPNVTVHAFGLAERNCAGTMSVSGDASSAHAGPRDLVVQFRAADEVLAGLHLSSVSLMKVNIEGGEYVLLKHLLSTNWVPKILDLQVQFHDFVPDAFCSMQTIQHTLAETHRLTYQYPFVWENWRLNEES